MRAGRVKTKTHGLLLPHIKERLSLKCPMIGLIKPSITFLSLSLAFDFFLPLFRDKEKREENERERERDLQAGEEDADPERSDANDVHEEGRLFFLLLSRNVFCEEKRRGKGTTLGRRREDRQSGDEPGRREGSFERL